MNRRALDRAIDSLSRAELRDYASELTEWVGADAASRLAPSGPFTPHASPPQLELGAVDLAAAAARLDHVGAVALAAIRAEALGDAALAAPFSALELLAGLERALRQTADECAAAARFDVRTGLDLTEALLRTLTRVRSARAVFSARWTAPSPDLGALLDRLGDSLAVSGVDESSFGMLVDVCHAADALDPDIGAWGLLGRAAAGERAPVVARWIARHLEHGPRADDALPMLCVLADCVLADCAEPTTLVQVAELHLDKGPEVFDLLSRTLDAAGMPAEARYWRDEGRSRYPGGVA